MNFMSGVPEPEMIQRASGGWLAVSPRDVAYRIGVVGDSEQDARRAYADSWRAWERLGALADARRERQRRRRERWLNEREGL